MLEKRAKNMYVIVNLLTIPLYVFIAYFINVRFSIELSPSDAFESENPFSLESALHAMGFLYPFIYYIHFIALALLPNLLCFVYRYGWKKFDSLEAEIRTLRFFVIIGCCFTVLCTILLYVI